MDDLGDPPTHAPTDLDLISEQSLAFFFETSPVLMGTVALLPDGDLLHLRDNPATANFFGLEPGVMAGRSARRLGVPEPVIALWRAQYERSAQLQNSVVFEYRHDEASEMTLHVTVAPLGLVTPAGDPCFGYVAQDVTEARAAERARLATETSLQLGLAAGGTVTWELDPAKGQITRSGNAAALFGPGETRDDYSARMWPADVAAFSRLHAEILAGARDDFELEHRYRHPDGRILWIHNRGRVQRGADGKALRIHGVAVDVSSRREAEDALREAEARLRASEARLRLALDAGRMAVFDWPLDQTEPPLTPEVRAQLGLAHDAPSNVADRRANYHPDDLALASRTRERALGGEEQFIDFDFRYLRPDGALRWLQVRSEVLRGADGRPERLTGVQTDVTERKADEERLQLLSREVDHRANNLLAVVQSLVALSRAEDLDSFRKVLLGRLEALARTHRRLADGSWSGASLIELLDEELRPFAARAADCVRLEGPDCALSPQEGQAMSLALHELATNAAKYGALAAPAGLVTVAWRVDDGVLRLLWEEQGGPPVEPPRRSGFGTNLLQRALGGALRGRTILTWRPEGLRCELTLPLARAVSRGG